jgi:hypothetical protein
MAAVEESGGWGASCMSGDRDAREKGGQRFCLMPSGRARQCAKYRSVLESVSNVNVGNQPNCRGQPQGSPK